MAEREIAVQRVGYAHSMEVVRGALRRLRQPINAISSVNAA